MGKLLNVGLLICEVGYVVVTRDRTLARKIAQSSDRYEVILDNRNLKCWVVHNRKGAATVVFTKDIETAIADLVAIREGKTQHIIAVGITTLVTQPVVCLEAENEEVADRKKPRDSLLVVQATVRRTQLLAITFPAVADIEITSALRSAAMNRAASSCGIVDVAGQESLAVQVQSDSGAEALFLLARKMGFNAGAVLLLNNSGKASIQLLVETVLSAINILRT